MKIKSPQKGDTTGCGIDQRFPRGLLDAAELLSASYHLVVTNVPYLVKGRQHEDLKRYCEDNYSDGRNDLSTVFMERCLELAILSDAGISQVVMPQNWLFLSGYRALRSKVLSDCSIRLLARLGSGAFDTVSGEVVNAILLTQSNQAPSSNSMIYGVNASAADGIFEKSHALRVGSLQTATQAEQLRNPDYRISFEVISGELLERSSETALGMNTSDSLMFVRMFWELSELGEDWEFHQSTVSETELWGGCERIVWFERGQGRMRALAAGQERDKGRDKQGINSWGRRGVAVSLMGDLPVSLYGGTKFDNNTGTVIPRNSDNLPAIWCYCSDAEFNRAVRRIDQTLKVTNATLGKVPFNLEHWQRVAAERYPNGLPRPYSDDPTQWLFHGHPQPATDPLQVAIARLAGYRWPAETDSAMELADEARTWIARCDQLVEHSDDDGIVCLTSVRGEAPAHDRLLKLLIAAWETVQPGGWRPAVLDKLLADADCTGKGLDVWLREKFFEQHVKRFQHRPFIWHVWDGLKDGFAALVNYHQLDTKNLERLIHTYLGDWIRQQEAGVRDRIDGAQQRLAAAQDMKRRLEFILEGEPPYDIFLRWKPLAEQPIGWNPDLNDGVRMNIRPFMTAEVLRHNRKPKLNITWDKDRGKDVDSAPWFKQFGGDRINDQHLTVAEKASART